MSQIQPQNFFFIKSSLDDSVSGLGAINLTGIFYFLLSIVSMDEKANERTHCLTYIFPLGIKEITFVNANKT